jgi:hypothetical protein
VAKNLYKNPNILVEKMTDQERRVQLARRFDPLIKEVVDDFIPVQQILDTYIPNFTGELDMGATEDPVDPEPAEEPEPEESPATVPEPESTPAPEGTPAPEAGTPAPEAETPMSEESEPVMTKQVPVKVHQETLFDDAPDK